MAKLVMKSFTGTKTVKACKMSRKSAEEFIGRKVRVDSDEIEDEAGYLVTYPDGYHIIRFWIFSQTPSPCN